MNAAIRINCSNCHKFYLVEGSVAHNLFNGTEKCFLMECKCGKDLTPEIKETYGDFIKFKEIYSNLCKRFLDDNEISKQLDELYDLYLRRIIK